jgi:endonuclease YncB( thermonuclease family)
VDGDTIRVDGKRVRLVGFDAPETSDEQARCGAEEALGQRAAARLAELRGPLDIRYRSERASPCDTVAAGPRWTGARAAGAEYLRSRL